MALFGYPADKTRFAVDNFNLELYSFGPFTGYRCSFVQFSRSGKVDTGPGRTHAMLSQHGRVLSSNPFSSGQKDVPGCAKNLGVIAASHFQYKPTYRAFEEDS